MNNQFRNFFEALKGTDIGTKVVIAMSSVAMIAALAVVGLVSADSHYEVVWPDLTKAEGARVSAALATRGIDFRQQYDKSKVTIVVNSTEVLKAEQAAAESGAIVAREKGILAAGSGGGVFDGAGERNQKLMAARWSQTELMLESLEFVDDAILQSLLQTGTSLRGSGPTSAAVVLATTGGISLSKEEGQRIANTVINSLGIDPKRLNIMDTNGRSVYSPEEESGQADAAGLDFQRSYDKSLEDDVNTELASIFGPNKVKVSVRSEFDFKQETVSKHEYLKAVPNSSRTLTTETPIGSSGGVGGLAGTASNTPNGKDDWGQGSAEVSAGSGGYQKSTTEETESTSNVGYEDSIVVSTQPELVRLSIGVGYDESLAGQEAKIDSYVKSMVGFVDNKVRSDNYSSDPFEFYVPEVAEGAPEESLTLPENGSMTTGFLVEKGVEIVSAIAFIALLLKGLKSAKGSGSAATSAGTSIGSKAFSADGTVMADVEIAPEQLARAQVEDMVKNNPERVAQILSNWVVEDRNTVNS
ncbi:MAG: flagellar M-ring protein FliF C-terminal domain-containing protein [Planctomycetota bacterium]|nr:flagellar M-ring protein FliF C-terminal domain-containing protein [Planctomycetota bacterium]MDG2143198.1 flagellar M-ring protein FliF C-terminal domain-containing protein [Planctomycetota bacterium]